MRKVIFGAAFAAFFASPAFAGQSAWIDGVHVVQKPLPRCAQAWDSTVPAPQLRTAHAGRPEVYLERGDVEEAVGIDAVDPFNGTNLAGQGTYIAIFGDPFGSILTYKFAEPQHFVRFVLGTPKQGDSIVFWTLSGSQYVRLGTVTGLQIVEKLANNVQPRQMTLLLSSPQPFYALSMAHQDPPDQNAAMELSNLSFGQDDTCPPIGR